jgi:hypothetical protein
MSYDAWKLATPPEYDAPGFEDETEALASERIEAIEETAEEEIESFRKDPSQIEEGCTFERIESEIIAEAMEDILYVLRDLDSGALYEEVCEIESERGEPDPDRGYDSRYDDD